MIVKQDIIYIRNLIISFMFIWLFYLLDLIHQDLGKYYADKLWGMER